MKTITVYPTGNNDRPRQVILENILSYGEGPSGHVEIFLKGADSPLVVFDDFEDIDKMIKEAKL